MREVSRRSSSSWVWASALRSMTSNALLLLRRVAASFRGASSPKQGSKRERCAQLVREHGQELVLEPRGVFGFVPGGLLALEQIGPFIFCLLACRVIAHHFDKAGQLAVGVAHRRQYAAAPEPRAALSHVPRFIGGPAILRRMLHFLPASAALAGFRRIDHRRALSDGLRGGPSQQPLRPDVPRDDPPARSMSSMAKSGAFSVTSRNRSSLSRRASSACLRAETSTNVITTPSMRLSLVRYGSDPPQIRRVRCAADNLSFYSA